MKKIISFFTIFITLIFLINAFAFSPELMDEVKAMVNFAIKYYDANGEKATLLEISNPQGIFNKTNVYAFIYDPQGTIMADPDNKLIGENVYNKPDVKGKLFRKELIDMANLVGEAWEEYTYLNPKTHKQTQKVAYAKKYKNLIFCAGFYN